MLRSTFFALLAGLLSVPLHAQKPEPMALPMHEGAMFLDLSGWKITQSSVKPRGREIGIRAHAEHSNMEMLAFLFLTPENTHQSAASCRKNELDEIAKSKPTHIAQSDGPNGSALAQISFTDHETVHAFWGKGDQCLSFEVYPDPKTKLDTTAALGFLARQNYDPTFIPRPQDKFIYAESLYRKHAYADAVPIYRDLLAKLPATGDTLTMRRVVTDNLGMSLGISGDITGARTLFNQAIASDPQYSLNYYNLACADAEEGKAAAAREHLQQAFDHRTGLIPGESFPDPVQDDSLQKLKSDTAFWKLATSISDQVKKDAHAGKTSAGAQ